MKVMDSEYYDVQISACFFVIVLIWNIYSYCLAKNYADGFESYQKKPKANKETKEHTKMNNERFS